MQVSHRQAHDDPVNSDFLPQPAKHFLNAKIILLSKITYCEYKCLFQSMIANLIIKSDLINKCDAVF